MSMSKAKKIRLILIDGNSLLHRGFHALPPTITTREGMPINAVFGFTSILLKALSELKPTYVAVAWDYPAPTFRHKFYKPYKATRQKAPDELYAQVPIVKQVIAALNIPLFEKKNFEADDLLGTLSEQAKKFKDLEVILVTGDLDALQLVDKKVKVYGTRKGISDTVVYDLAGVDKRYGLTPKQFLDYKALRGDPSDNIPGVAGVGEKTAIKLLQAFGSLDELYHRLHETVELKGDKFEQKKVKVAGKLFEKLRDQEKQAYLSKKLATIKRDVPIKFKLADASLVDYDRDKVVKLFAKLQFKSLLKRLPGASELAGKVPAEVLARDKNADQDKEKLFEARIAKKLANDYHLVDNLTKLRNMISVLSNAGEFAVDTETSNLGPMGCELVGLSLCAKAGQAYYVPLAHEKKLGKTCSRKGALKILKPLLENTKIKKIGHNIKYDLVVLKNYGVDIKPLSFDSMVVSYLLDPGRRQNSLDALAFNLFGYEMMPMGACIGSGRKQCSFAQVDLARATFYAAEDADYTWRIKPPLWNELKKIQATTKIWTDLELPLIRILAEMEFRGVKIDATFLGRLARQYSAKVRQLKKQIYKLAGGEFNISSPKQLQEILFEKLHLSTEGIKRTKTGYSTAASELEKMRGKSPMVDKISEYRELTKLISTYLDALPNLIVSDTGRVHTSFNQTITATGRLSSSDPNLQNIPVRTKIGKEIRKAFVASPGAVLISLDYSQIELRIAAHFSKDPALRSAFKSGKDIHLATAARVLHKKIASVTTAERNAAKMMNFGVIYGLSAFGLARRSGMSRTAAGEFIDTYFSSYKVLKEYLDKVVEQAGKKGYVETLFGRRRYLPNLASSNWQVRAAAERAAVNHPFQGTNADIIKKAMIEIREKMPQTSDMLIMQVHDELIFEVPKKEAANIASGAKKIMENVVKLRVPIKVDVKMGTNWGQLKLQ